MILKKSDKDIWLILQKIREELIKGKSRVIVYSATPKEYKKEMSIFRELNSWGAIYLFQRHHIPTSIIYRRGKKILKKTEKYLIPFRVEQKFKEVFQFFQEKQKTIPTKIKIQKTEEGRTLITRDKEGDFYYKNKLIELENKDAIYYLIFECLYGKGNLEGFCSYKTINKYLEEHGKKKLTGSLQKNNRIKNGIINLFRFSELPQKTPDGKKIIQKVRGKGIILYNPPF